MQDASIGIVFPPNHHDQVLWVKRRDLNIWVLPGGGIDLNESPNDAVIREVYEESHLKVKIIRQTLLLEPVNSFTRTTHIFLCESENSNSETTEESAEVNFFFIDKPPKPFFPLHQVWLKESIHSRGLIKRPMNEFSWIKVGKFFLKHPVILGQYALQKLLRG